VRLRKSLKNNANILRFVGRPDETIEKAAFSHGLNTDETRMGNRRRGPRGRGRAERVGKAGGRFYGIIDRIDAMNKMGSQIMVPLARDCPPSS